MISRPAADQELVALLVDPALESDVERWWHVADAGFAALVPAVAEVLDRPVVSDERAVSFVLHAPLELLARRGLHRLGNGETLERVEAVRLVSLAVRYANRPGYAGLALPVDEGREGSATGVFADDVVDRTAAAAHGNVYLHLVDSVPSADLAPMSSGLRRELTTDPETRIGVERVEPAASVAEAIADLPFIGPAPDRGIAGLVAHALTEARPGLARLVATVERSDDDRRELLRAAARSMLEGGDAFVPYGWTHALTLAQGALSVAPMIADRRRADVTAAVHVGAAVAAYPRSGATEIGVEPPPDGWDGVVAAAQAAHDAHMVKYTLACMQAADADPEGAELFLQATCRLHAWWAERPPDDDPLQTA